MFIYSLYPRNYSAKIILLFTTMHFGKTVLYCRTRRYSGPCIRKYNCFNGTIILFTYNRQATMFQHQQPSQYFMNCQTIHNSISFYLNQNTRTLSRLQDFDQLYTKRWGALYKDGRITLCRKWLYHSGRRTNQGERTERGSRIYMCNSNSV